MKNLRGTFLLVVLFIVSVLAVNKNTITYKSNDGVNITADVYLTADFTAPFIVLFHQAGWSRGEYNEIAPKLNSMGFNCMAVDLRSGKSVNGVTNMTHKDALVKKKPTNYLDAYPDIETSVKYARKHYAHGKLIIWGSSYSAALDLKYAGDNPSMVNGVLSFSPGEYFKKEESDNFISKSAGNISVPTFITSARNEKKNWLSIYLAIPIMEKMYFVPETSGHHGSRSLWSKFDDSNDYWIAVSTFLDKYFPREKINKI